MRTLSRLLASLFVVPAAAVAFADPTFTVVSTLRVDDFRTTALAVNDLGQAVGSHAYTGTTTVGKKSRAYQGFSAFLTAADSTTVTEVLPLTGLGTAVTTSTSVASEMALTTATGGDSDTTSGTGSGAHGGGGGGSCDGGKGAVFTSTLTAINASGVAAGESSAAVASGTKTIDLQHAVVFSGGKLTDLGALSATGSSTASGINASGLVVGASSVAGTRGHAFSDDGTTMTDLGTLGGKYSAATAVNDAGTIVGGASLSTGVTHPFSFASGTMTDLGLPTGFASAKALAISSAGTIVGRGDVAATTGTGRHAHTVHTTHAFLFSGGAYTDLGSLYTNARSGLASPIVARGVNASGIVVGDTQDTGGKPRAFVYQGGTLYDLNASLPTADAGYTLVSATSITDGGYVSAIAVDASGKQYGLVLKLG